MTDPVSRRGSRVVLALALIGGLAILAWLVFNPSDATPSSAIHDSNHWLVDHGAPSWLANGLLLDFIFNVAMFVPLGLVGSLLWRRPGISGWTLISFGASATIETIQLLFLPGRTWSIADIAANSLGGLIGAWLARAVDTKAKESRAS